MLTLIKAILAGHIQTREVDTFASPLFRGKLTQNAGCNLCGQCQQICPVQALSLKEAGQVEIDYKKCLFCGKCVDVCASGALKHEQQDALPEILARTQVEIAEIIQKKAGRSLNVRHLDAGSCNACDFEMGALSNPIYDLRRYGISFVASPRHADMVMVTGVVTRNLEQAVKMAYEAMVGPKLVMAVGACATGGATFGDTYAIVGAVEKVLPVDIAVPGCPPRPSAMLIALVAAADLYLEKIKE